MFKVLGRSFRQRLQNKNIGQLQPNERFSGKDFVRERSYNYSYSSTTFQDDD